MTYIDHGITSDDPRVAYRRERGARRLLVAIALGTPMYEVLQISDEAEVALSKVLDRLGCIDPDRLVNPDTHDGHAALRRQLRLIAGCLFDDDSERELIARTLDLIDNPRMTVAHARHILFGEAKGRGGKADGENGEVSVWDYRKIANAIRDGVPQKKAAEDVAGVGNRFGYIVGTFLGYDTYRRDTLVESAWKALQKGDSAAAWGRAVGLKARTARDWFARAREAYAPTQQAAV